MSAPSTAPCRECGSDLVTECTCPDGMADCFSCGAVFVPLTQEERDVPGSVV